jgi:hypothetical protein
MSWGHFIHFLADLLPLLRLAIAAAWDVLADVSSLLLWAAIGVWLVARLLNLWLLQRRLNRDVPDATDGKAPSLWWLEAQHSATVQGVGAVLGVVLLPVLLVFGAVWALRRWLKRRKEAAAAAEADKNGVPLPPEPPPCGILVASVGPSLVDGALAAWALWAVVLAADWLLALKHGLGPGASGVDFVLSGLSPDLGWIWPLERFPQAHFALATFIWLSVWWYLARLARLVYAKDLTANLYRDEHTFDGLPRWRQWYASWTVWRADTSLVHWLRWLLVAALPLLLLATTSIDPTPYSVAPAPLALAWATWWSLGAHLVLKGRFEPVPPQLAFAATGTERAGWPEVRADLERRLRASFPDGAMTVRPVQRLRIDTNASATLEPLLAADLLPGLALRAGDVAGVERGLVLLQADVLADLAANRPVDTRVERETEGGLTLHSRRSTAQAGSDVRWSCVVAPEGSGKTTAGMLAACEVAVVDARTTLVLCRTRAAAQAWRERFDRLVSPTTLRWNIGSAQMGEDCTRRLGRGEVPDVVTLSLDELVTDLLANPPAYAALLQRTALVIVEDLESFCGPVEQHLQLALRRLKRQLRRVGAYVQGADGGASVAVLALLQPSAPDIVAWAKAMCGEERMLVRHYGGGVQPAGVAVLQLQLMVPLSQIRKPNGHAVGVQDVVDSCERLGVPWTWRRAGDASRHLGRSAMALREEPKWYRDDAAEAAVVLVSGAWAAVQREWELLTAAGRAFSCFHVPDANGRLEPDFPSDPGRMARNAIAVLSLVDGDENMAFAEPDHGSELARHMRRLPRPLVRRPQGDVAEAHLVADMLHDGGIEVGEALAIFGQDVGAALARLVDGELATARPRVDVRPDGIGHLTLVDVRVHSDALPRPDHVRDLQEQARLGLARREADLAAARRRGQARDIADAEVLLTAARHLMRNPLPIQAPPRDVEVGALGGVRLLDRTSGQAVAAVDIDSVPTLYYPGRVFELDAGRYVVREDVTPGDSQAATAGALGDVPVEPWTDTAESSPRRRIALQWSAGALHAQGNAAEPAWAGSPGPLPPATATATSSNADATGPLSRPVSFGRHALAVSLGSASVLVQHIATVHLDPLHGHIVRLTLLTAAERVAFEARGRIDTRVLALAPWHAAISAEGGTGAAMGLEPEAVAPAPQVLTRDLARLLAAAMRMALPSLFRGADLTCGVGVVPALASYGSAEDEHGIVLYDLQRGGASVVDAIERDGLEILLRMARRVLERVLYHDRLMVRFDEWGDEAELLEAAQTEDVLRAAEQDHGQEAGKMAPQGRRARDAERRRRALTWLDGVLQPEGTPVGANSARGYGSDIELGEGDRFDLGRAWYTRDGSVANLVWAKHRWLLAPGVEAAMDTGVDGHTAQVAAAWLVPAAQDDDPERASILRSMRLLTEKDGTSHAPGSVQWLVLHDEIGTSEHGLATDVSVPWAAAAAWSWMRMGKFSELLRKTWGEGPSPVRVPRGRTPERDGFARVRTLAAFVQAMANDPDRRGVSGLPATPLHTLAARSGGALDKALLFAVLAWQSGMQAGLFVRVRGEGPVDVMGAFGVGSVTTSGLDKTEYLPRAWDVLEAWRVGVGLEAPVPFFAVGRGFTLVGTMEAEDLVFAPIDVTAELDPGVVYAGEPKDWAFVPLTTVPVFHAPPGYVRLKVELEPPTPDPDAPPLPPEPAIARRSYDPDPLHVQGDDIVRQHRFRDPNDGQWHEVEIRLSVAAVREAVGNHGVPRDVLAYKYRDAADLAEKKAQLRKIVAARGLCFDEDERLGGDQAGMARRGSVGLESLVEALRKAAGAKVAGRAWSGFLAGFVQSLPYRVPKDELIGGKEFYTFEVMPPLETLARGWGDCDTKSVLFAALSLAASAPTPILVSVPVHMFGGACLEPRAGETSVRVGDTRYVLVELTGEFALGSVGDQYLGIDGSGRHGESFHLLTGKEAS